jgi:hypothetical protein
MNHLINHRLQERQQMRWCPAGAHYLMQVRAGVLNAEIDGSLFAKGVDLPGARACPGSHSSGSRSNIK